MQLNNENTSDAELLNRLRRGEEAALDCIFNKYYKLICYASYRVLSDATLAEDLAQEVFYDVWRKREKINISSSLPAYLKKAVVNKSLNYIRDKKINFAESEHHLQAFSVAPKVEDVLDAQELSTYLKKVIHNLPEKVKMAFTLSRNEGLSYKEIATQLDISPKTVENQIGKALKILRNALHQYRSREEKN